LFFRRITLDGHDDDDEQEAFFLCLSSLFEKLVENQIICVVRIWRADIFNEACGASQLQQTRKVAQSARSVSLRRVSIAGFTVRKRANILWPEAGGLRFESSVTFASSSRCVFLKKTKCGDATAIDPEDQSSSERGVASAGGRGQRAALAKIEEIR